MPITRPWNYGIPRTTEELHSNHAESVQVAAAAAKDTVLEAIKNGAATKKKIMFTAWALLEFKSPK